MLDEENIRQWLITTHGYQGQGEPPQIPAEVRVDLAEKYVSAFETLTGEAFEPQVGPVQQRIAAALTK